MAAPGFLIGGSSLILRFGSSNIHGLYNKLDSPVVIEWLYERDIIFLCELKTDIEISVPGFRVIRSHTENPIRGGAALLVRNYLYEYVIDVDLSEFDQIWFRLLQFPTVLFGACYIPPAESKYYHDSNHAFIQAKCESYPCDTKVIFGDTNSRLGQFVNQVLDRICVNVSYHPVDEVPTLKPHAKKLLAIAKQSDMYFVNNLKYKEKLFKGGLSFRRKANWISELDYCLISKSSIDIMSSFDMDHRLLFPSDHAPISFTLSLESPPCTSDVLLKRAKNLGSHLNVAVSPEPLRIAPVHTQYSPLNAQSSQEVIRTQSSSSSIPKHAHHLMPHRACPLSLAANVPLAATSPPVAATPRVLVNPPATLTPQAASSPPAAATPQILLNPPVALTPAAAPSPPAAATPQVATSPPAAVILPVATNLPTEPAPSAAVNHAPHPPPVENEASVVKRMCKRPISHSSVEKEPFLNSLPSDSICDMIARCDNADEAVNLVTDTLYECARQNTRRQQPHTASDTPESNSPKWRQIMSCNDDKALWKAVNWKGEVTFQEQAESPSDEAFRVHLETVLNPANSTPPTIDPNEVSGYNSLLDDPIDPVEVDRVINEQIKPNKSPGIDGISPGIMKWLPAQWIITLAFLFNIIFYATYPFSWCYNRLKMLHKKGPRDNCDNYRGISIMGVCAKVYDYVINNRLMAWFTPYREQAGALPGRSCIEHILSLRLLITYCKRKRLKLYIVFVDFSKAYDRIRRNMLIKSLIQIGCSLVMLLAIVEMYKVTKCLLGGSIITASAGVRQGSPTSCFLFIIFVNTLVKLIKDNSPADGFLGWLHLLMLMDDTIILATSRERLIQKLRFLDIYCDSHGMLVNEDKTKLMVINGDADDRQPIPLQNILITHCWKYVYLGSIFTSDGNLSSMLLEHVKAKRKHLNKFIIFVKSNPDMPFIVKRKVLDAAFNAAILYGCETWIGVSCQCVNTLYIAAIKALLGVRPAVPNDLCLAEIGAPTLQSLVTHRQAVFLRRISNDPSRSGGDDPLTHVISLVHAGDRKTSRIISSLLSSPPHLEQGRADLREKITMSDGTRFQTYTAINPNLSVHEIYSLRQQYIPDYMRIPFSRMRLSSHRLKIETGRWSGIPRERRLCPCGEIQDEKHVLEFCPLTDHIRQAYSDTVIFPDILRNNVTLNDCKFIKDVCDNFA